MGITIRSKLWIGFGVFFLILIITSLIIFGNVRRMERALNEITAVEEPTSAAAYEMEINTIEIGMKVLQYLDTGDPQYRSGVAKDEADFELFKTQYDRLAETQKGKDFGKRISLLFREYTDLGENLMNTWDERAGRAAAISTDAAGAGGVESVVLRDEQQRDLARFSELRAELDAILDDEIQILTSRDLEIAKADAGQTVANIFVTILAMLGVGLIVGSGAAVTISGGIVKSVRKLVEGADKIGGGAFDHRIEITTNDEMSVLAAAFNRMTEKRQQAEERLRLLESAVHQADESVMITSAELDEPGPQIVFANPAFAKMTGYTLEEAMGRTPRMLQGPKTHRHVLDRLRQNLSDGQKFYGETVNYRKDGAEYNLEWHISPVRNDDGETTHFVSIQRDITERKRIEEEIKELNQDLDRRVVERTAELEAANGELQNQITERLSAEQALKRSEEQLRQSQKMDAIGRLAGGIAHDFNNLLTIITGYSSMWLKRIKPEEPIREDLEEIKRAADRAADLTRQLLAFSRKQVLQPKVIDLNAVVSGIDKMLRRLIGEHIECLTVLEPGLSRVEADPGQLEQLIINLVVNARDAMPGGGRLTIETADALLDETYVNQHVTVQPGRYVMLAVSDTGCGMDAETRERIFEPFFTTKEVGQGTGLGLSTVYGIVKQSGGYVWVYSEVGYGTTFKIYLPRVEQPVAATKADDVADEVTSKNTETVLLVEDEEGLRKMTQKILRMNNYTVLEASNGVEALEVCERHRGAINLVLTDVMMPQMGGHELAERLAGTRPEAKILYMSGYTDRSIVHHGVLDAGTEFISKPFAPDYLARKVREVLNMKG